MLPDHGGIPLHEKHNGTTYFMLEVHYNNPKLIQCKTKFVNYLSQYSTRKIS